jgi:hypothetical protein
LIGRAQRRFATPAESRTPKAVTAAKEFYVRSLSPLAQMRVGLRVAQS